MRRECRTLEYNPRGCRLILHNYTHQSTLLPGFPASHPPPSPQARYGEGVLLQQESRSSRPLRATARTELKFFFFFFFATRCLLEAAAQVPSAHEFIWFFLETPKIRIAGGSGFETRLVSYCVMDLEISNYYQYFSKLFKQVFVWSFIKFTVRSRQRRRRRRGAGVRNVDKSQDIYVKPSLQRYS